jgi:hypothetical protein
VSERVKEITVITVDINTHTYTNYTHWWIAGGFFRIEWIDEDGNYWNQIYPAHRIVKILTKNCTKEKEYEFKF